MAIAGQDIDETMGKAKMRRRDTLRRRDTDKLYDVDTDNLYDAAVDDMSLPSIMFSINTELLDDLGEAQRTTATLLYMEIWKSAQIHDSLWKTRK
jgi:hypothetical protein